MDPKVPKPKPPAPPVEVEGGEIESEAPPPAPEPSGGMIGEGGRSGGGAPDPGERAKAG